MLHTFILRKLTVNTLIHNPFGSVLRWHVTVPLFFGGNVTVAYNGGDPRLRVLLYYTDTLIGWSVVSLSC